MGKFIVRFTIVAVAIYFTLSYIFAQFLGVDIMTAYYVLLFELCMTVYCFSEGKYHCKYMKSTMLSIFFADAITLLDNDLDFLTVEAHNLIPIAILALGITVSIALALNHFRRVYELKRAKKTRYDTIEGSVN